MKPPQTKGEIPMPRSTKILIILAIIALGFAVTGFIHFSTFQFMR